MKKLFLIAFLALGFITMSANNDYGRRQETGRYYKGNIPANQLPEAINKYLGKNYSGYTIMVSKQKGNGYYYIKIRYNENSGRPYYRSLVFDNNGNVVKG